MKLEDLEIYNLAMLMGDQVWEIVEGWDYFAKDTVGKQWVRAIDSVAANISEGFGRNTFKDSRSFYYIARGSLYESKTWLDKAKNRKLILVEYQTLLDNHNKLGIKLNNFISKHTNLMNQK
jgi:four helix bundle protein